MARRRNADRGDAELRRLERAARTGDREAFYALRAEQDRRGMVWTLASREDADLLANDVGLMFDEIRHGGDGTPYLLGLRPVVEDSGVGPFDEEDDDDTFRVPERKLWDQIHNASTAQLARYAWHRQNVIEGNVRENPGDEHLRGLQRAVEAGDPSSIPPLVTELTRVGKPFAGGLEVWRGQVVGRWSRGGDGGEWHGLLSPGQAAEAVAVLSPRRGTRWDDPRLDVVIAVRGAAGDGWAPISSVDGIPAWVEVLRSTNRLLPKPPRARRPRR